MKLDEIRLQGVQSYHDEQVIRLEPGMTLLAGRNNVGKSALLRALRLFSEPQPGLREDFKLALSWTSTSTASLQPAGYARPSASR